MRTVNATCLVLGLFLVVIPRSAQCIEWRIVPWIELDYTATQLDLRESYDSFRPILGNLSGGFETGSSTPRFFTWLVGASITESLLMGLEFSGSMEAEASHYASMTDNSGNSVWQRTTLQFEAKTLAWTTEYFFGDLERRVRLGVGLTGGMVSTSGKTSVSAGVGGFGVGVSVSHQKKNGPLAATKAMLDVRLHDNFFLSFDGGYRYAKVRGVQLERQPPDPADRPEDWDADFSGWFVQVGVKMWFLERPGGKGNADP